MRLLACGLAAAVALVVTAGCGGGGSNKVAPPSAGNAPGAPASTQSQTTFILSNGASTHALPSVAGYGGSVTLSGVSAPQGTSMTISTSTTAPAGASFPQSALRRPQSNGGLSILFFLTFQATANVTLGGFPSFSISFPSSANAAGQFFLALSDPNAQNVTQQFRTSGPAGVNGTTLSFGAVTDPLTFSAGTKYTIALYAVEEETRLPGLFYPLYTGEKRKSLDVIQGTGEYSPATDTITLSALMPGPIADGKDNYYIWGIDRGGSTSAPFPQEPNVKFNAVISVEAQSEGGANATLILIPGGSTPLQPSAVRIDGAKITVSVLASLLPTTGPNGPASYQWNLWPRSEVGGPVSQISKFIPENALAPLLPGVEAAAPPAGSPGPSPSVSPSGSPAPTPTPSATPSPGGSPTPTPSPTPSPMGMVTVHVGFELEDIDDPTFGQVAYYAITPGNSAQIIRVAAGSSIVFVNDDPSGSPHTASGLGTGGFPASFNNTSGTTQSGTTIDSGMSWSTGTLTKGQSSQVFTIPAPGTYYFGCAFHYSSQNMRDVVVAT